MHTVCINNSFTACVILDARWAFRNLYSMGRAIPHSEWGMAGHPTALLCRCCYPTAVYYIVYPLNTTPLFVPAHVKTLYQICMYRIRLSKSIPSENGKTHYITAAFTHILLNIVG